MIQLNACIFVMMSLFLYRRHSVTDSTHINDHNKTIQNWLIYSVGIYIALVLNLMEPFGITIQSFIFIYHLMLTSYGLISAAAVWLMLRWVPEHLSIVRCHKSHLGLLAWVLVLVLWVSFANWLYSQLLHHTISGWHNMYVPVRSFFDLMPQFLAIYAVWGLLSGTFIYLLPATEDARSGAVAYLDEMMLLPSENQSDAFKLKPSQLVCLKTSDNYLEVYYLNEQEEIQNRMIRSSMKRMQENLDEDMFYRPHQSYLVNLAYIKGLKKVQNNHFLEMAYLDFDVAISRKRVKHIKSHVVN